MSTPIDASFYAVYRDLLFEFLAELRTMSQSATTLDAFQRALQTFCDELRPWLTPADVPPAPAAVFSLFTDCMINEETDITTVQLSPEGKAFFRAWVRRQTVLAEAAAHINPGRSH